MDETQPMQDWQCLSDETVAMKQVLSLASSLFVFASCSSEQSCSDPTGAIFNKNGLIVFDDCHDFWFFEGVSKRNLIQNNKLVGRFFSLGDNYLLLCKAKKEAHYWANTEAGAGVKRGFFVLDAKIEFVNLATFNDDVPRSTWHFQSDSCTISVTACSSCAYDCESIVTRSGP